MPRGGTGKRIVPGSIGDFVNHHISTVPGDIPYGWKNKEAVRLFTVANEKWTLSNMKSAVERFVRRQEGIKYPSEINHHKNRVRRAKGLDASAALVTNVQKELEMLSRELTRLKGIEGKYNRLMLAIKE